MDAAEEFNLRCHHRKAVGFPICTDIYIYIYIILYIYIYISYNILYNMYIYIIYNIIQYNMP